MRLRHSRIFLFTTMSKSAVEPTQPLVRAVDPNKFNVFLPKIGYLSYTAVYFFQINVILRIKWKGLKLSNLTALKAVVSHKCCHYRYYFWSQMLPLSLLFLDTNAVTIVTISGHKFCHYRYYFWSQMLPLSLLFLVTNAATIVTISGHKCCHYH
jgi:hypothetical protein